MNHLRSRRAANSGLTLMELLVVLVIVAVVAGFAVLSTVSLGGDTPAERNARRIAALVQLASENAVMEGRQYGLEIKPHAYRFFQYDGASWQPVKDDNTFRPRQVDGDVTLSLQLEGRPITLPQPVSDAMAMTTPPNADGAPAADQPTSGPQPQIVALSSGELSAFDLAVAGPGGDGAYHVRGQLNGKVQLIPPDSKVFNP